ncbi:MAG: glycosyltransferase [Nitrospina sp.]|jgi:GT2 family glycosyltransferase|nr:glycosyltransferase [Nitrospina sp.]
MLVSVIIPSYNRRHELCRCIDSILAQRSVSIEIIVVDDCSQDDTRELLTLNYPHIRFILSQRRVGPSHLRNLGLRAAKGEYVLFLDSDVVLPRKGIIHEMAIILSKTSRIGELGGEIPVYRNITDKAVGKRRDFFGQNHDVISKRDGEENPLKECTYLATCNCMVRKDVAFEVGGFDPYYKFGGEDADFGYRILSKGYCNLVCFSVGVHHFRSVHGRYPDETLRYHRTRIRFNLKHYSPPRNLLIAAVDCMKAGWFYLLLGPKIFLKKIRHVPLVTENYLGGWYLIKVYLENIRAYGKLIRQEHTDFLADAEIERFERQSAD